MQKITTFLWFDDKAEEAINFYVSIFKNSRILSASRSGEGRFFSGTFQLEGQEFMALNGGPVYHFTPAISLFVDCQNQAEVDNLWNRLLEGGKESQCGWLTDRFGLSWQIVPSVLGKLLSDPDPAKAGRAMQAMLKMKKLIIADLEKAHAGS